MSHRGQKRGREIDSLDSESDADNHLSKGKTSRRRHYQSSTSESDLSMDDGQFSKDPLCKGRRIGEEWEAHGIQFKVAQDGQRLRKALVKETRPKFTMVSFLLPCIYHLFLMMLQPVDSEHPDRTVHVVALVERWLTEEEFKIVKDRQELAWQDHSSDEPAQSGDVRFALYLYLNITESLLQKGRFEGGKRAFVAPYVSSE